MILILQNFLNVIYIKIVTDLDNLNTKLIYIFDKNITLEDYRKDLQLLEVTIYN